ncbi:pilus assembly protein [[Empedobacter] haloabium]|uniref:Pilus assembly protein n=1 Tax=[Empedobacter] haloabium TaxID=592317 RepID=A0ABZ1UQF8_9BURK
MTLVVSLLMLAAVLLLAASSASVALMGEKSARAERDRHIALQAAEDALMDAELEIEGLAAVPAERRALLRAPDSFGAGCGSGLALGLCARGAAGEPPPWQAVDLADASRSVALGSFTGTVTESADGLLPLRKPRYIVERLPYRPPGAEAGAAEGYLYRVTAVGFGSRPGTQVVLQSTWRPADE